MYFYAIAVSRSYPRFIRPTPGTLHSPAVLEEAYFAVGGCPRDVIEYIGDCRSVLNDAREAVDQLTPAGPIEALLENLVTTSSDSSHRLVLLGRSNSDLQPTDLTTDEKTFSVKGGVAVKALAERLSTIDMEQRRRLFRACTELPG